MTPLNLTQKDFDAADRFLTTYLSEKIPAADFSAGSVVRDFSIGAIAHVFAFLRQELATLKAHRSLTKLAALPVTADVEEAVDDLLSNWFLTRKPGRPGRVMTTLHFLQAVDVVIGPNVRFFRTPTLGFRVEAETGVTIPARNLFPALNPDGTVRSYSYTVALQALDVGATTNVPPGRFVSVDSFNPYFLHAENLDAGSEGTDVETPAQAIARAKTALTVRNLVNVRSIDTVLRQNFAQVSRVTVVGFGDAEMQRDRLADILPGHSLHTGGKVDVYVQLPLTQVTEVLEVGAPYLRPDGQVVVLRAGGSDDFRDARLGDVVRVCYDTNATPPIWTEHRVTAVTDKELTVHTQTPFPSLTDEMGGTVAYTVGRLSPAYSDVYLQRTGATSRRLQAANAVLLAPRPRGRILSVNRGTASTVGQLLERVNHIGALTGNTFRLVELEPALTQSRYAVSQLQVASGGEGGYVHVTYEAPVGYDAVQAYVSDDYERVLCADTLVKGYHPAYLQLNLQYTPSINATGVLDAAALRQSLVEDINSHAGLETLELSQLVQRLRTRFPDIGTVYGPLVARYTLHAPDGQTYDFLTSDVLSVTGKGGSALTNAAQLRSGNQLTSLGVTDRNVRYLARYEDIKVEVV